MVARTDTGWGWLYDVPWTAGNYHDFMTLERIRSVRRRERRRPTCWGRGRGGCARQAPPAGIQRDADTEPMSLAYKLPRHVSQDTVYPSAQRRPTVRNVGATMPA